MGELESTVKTNILALYPSAELSKIDVSVQLASGLLKEKLHVSLLVEEHYTLLFETSLWRFNLLGSEGISSESSSGVSTSYSSKMPESILNMIKSKSRARGV